MLRKRKFLSVFICVHLWPFLYAENWPQWRGPSLNGVSGEQNLPVKWSTTENVAWKLAMPSKSGATPIIWGNRIFLNVADGGDLYLWCVDKRKGAPLWKTIDRARRLQDQQAEHVVSLTRDRWHGSIRHDGNRRLKSFRFRRQGTVGARYPERLRQVRRQTGATRRRPCCMATDSTLKCCTEVRPRTLLISCASIRNPARPCGAWNGAPTPSASRRIRTQRRRC